MEGVQELDAPRVASTLRRDDSVARTRPHMSQDLTGSTHHAGNVGLTIVSWMHTVISQLRRSREGGNPVSVEKVSERLVVLNAGWIPAFAGTTCFGRV